MSLHLPHVARAGTLDVRAGVIIGGVSTTTTHAGARTASPRPGLRVDVVEPFRRWRLRYEGHGHLGPDGDGRYFYLTEVRSGNDVGFETVQYVPIAP